MSHPLPGELAVSDLREWPAPKARGAFGGNNRGLIGSIRRRGILAPLLVRPIGQGVLLADGEWRNVDHFQVVDGNRRLTAAKAAGLAAVPVIVQVMTDAEAACSRDDLNTLRRRRREPKDKKGKVKAK